MPTTTRAVRALLQRIDRCNSDCIAETGETCPERIADLIEQALEDPRHRRAVLIGLASYLAATLVGAVPDITL